MAQTDSVAVEQLASISANLSELTLWADIKREVSSSLPETADQKVRGRINKPAH
jgi:hypothetical protein